LTKNFFALMQFRWTKAVGACALLAFLNLLPFLGLWLAPGWGKLGFGVACAAIAALYFGLSRWLPVSPWHVLVSPLSTILLIYTMVRSMAHAARHRGVVWRGTRYSLEELRRGLV
jgi:hypothetical protein